jgi:hypothetical protein
VAGTATINTTNINTTGGQTYTGPVILTDDVNFAANSGSMVEFVSTVTGATQAVTAILPPWGLTVTTANVRFGGPVGADDTIASVNVSAGTATIHANITTTGAQTYEGMVALGGASPPRVLQAGTILAPETVTLGAGLGRIEGNGTALTINGTAVLNGSGGTAIGALVINGDATFREARLNALSVRCNRDE